MPCRRALSTHQSPVHWLKEDKPEAPTRQTEGSLQMPGQARGIHTPHRTPQPVAPAPLVGWAGAQHHVAGLGPERSFTTSAPSLGPLPPPVSWPHSPCQQLRESLSK